MLLLRRSPDDLIAEVDARLAEVDGNFTAGYAETIMELVNGTGERDD